MASGPFSSVACCKEEENFARMQMTIQTVCHKVLIEYLVKKVSNIGPGVSIDKILATNKTYITSGRDGRLYEKRYFPLDANNQRISTNIQDWDIQILSFFLKTFCNLSQAEKDDIDFIREKRNYLSHLGKPMVADHLYTTFRSCIDGIFKQMFICLGNSKFEEEIKEDLKSVDNRLAKQLVDFHKAYHREIVLNFNNVEEELGHIRLALSEQGRISESHTIMLQRILKTVQEKAISPDKLEPPESSAGKIIAKNCRSPQEEQKVSDAIMRNIGGKESENQSCVEKIQQYGSMTSLGKGCVEYSIQFNTLQSCLCYMENAVSGKLDEVFVPLQDALRQEFKNDFLELTVNITDAQFEECLSKVCITLENALAISKTKLHEVVILSCETDISEALVTNRQGPLIVATIDIGTSYSGYAYSLGKKIYTSKYIGSPMTNKTPTKVLLTPNKLFHKFGSDAEAAYVELAVEGKHKEWFYFENMKMQLYKQKNISRHMEIADVTGKKMEALTVFSMIITYFKEEVLRKLNKMLRVMKHDDIKWVLTVPAIWDDSATLFMRTAAEMAGIHESHLQLGLEAETGSIYCKALALQTPREELLFPGCRFVALDLGGGTVDVTAYEVKCDGTLGEIHKAGGGDWGGNMVNDAYIEMLWRIFGKDIVEKFQQDNQVEFLDIQNEFETKKRGFTNASQTMILRDLCSLVSFVQELTGITFPSLIKKAGLDGDISYRRGKLSLSGQMFAELFKATIESIVGYLQNLLDSAEIHNSIDMLLLVGGFSQSPVVRNALQDTFPHTPIYCPEDAELAVMKGAVIFGHMPSVITSRISRHSYGVAVMRDAEVGCPEQNLYIDPNGKLLMKNVFCTYTQVGESIDNKGYTIHRVFNLVDVKRPIVVLLYSSAQNGTEFITDNECEKRCEFMLECSPSWQYYDVLDIIYSVCQTGITLQIQHLDTGEMSQGFFDFLP